ncbi:hypothetical protein GCM10008014_09040 [Paenibacillus silvae]|uniref:Uncharacterized protein n=1 Tax=Paenibacillus silvae TaxID=1325358 RepID=A0ABQ1Z3B3_9BACL|nr:hypothetical protein [Paenibacillus silvae]GGH46392.1 hypothetical protein GCM10008014_09040 [Paenibacillus silvae]
MKYYPMPENVKEQSKNARYSYTVLVNLYANQDSMEEYINRNVRIISDEKLAKDELAQRAANVVNGLIESRAEFKSYNQVQVVGITFANAYDSELK